MTAPICRVAVPAPLRRCFDYTLAAAVLPEPGVRVRVPFGRRELIGVLVNVGERTPIARERLKPVLSVIDREPVFAPELFGLLRWAAEYYHHPLGEVLAAALPFGLRQGRELRLVRRQVWRLAVPVQEISAALKRAPLQRRLVAALAQASEGLDAQALGALSARWRAALRELMEKGWVRAEEYEPAEPPATAPQPAPALTAAQSAAVAAISQRLGSYGAFLLDGVTGSGKTEVYLQLIEAVLAAGKQALVLLPEIGLTPQFVGRVRSRFPVPVALLHSSLTDQERLEAWLKARSAKAAIVIGARSAVFAPLQNPGVIIVDEEHDASYKQHEGFRYHARDVAVMRAHREHIPIVLGSATPSLDSLKRVADGSYERLALPDRAGRARLPEVKLLDLRRLALSDGLSAPLIEQIGRRLQAGEQSLLFLNRRGYAPAFMCHDCGWLAPCARCDARLTLHRRSERLRCHHCGAEQTLPSRCPACGGCNLRALGAGTERVELALARFFPRARIVRIDRDSTRRRGALEQKLASIDAGEADILVGTQMLSKGHDFPNVTLVGVLNADQRLYSVDFRAAEQLVQQIIQVSGRAGRGEKPGEVWIQTYHPDDPVFAALRRHDYGAFAEFALSERRAAGYPPFARLALLRAESPKPQAALAFVEAAHALAGECQAPGVELMDPVPAPMERRAGRYRAQLLVQAGERRALHAFLTCWLAHLEESPLAKRVRWSLDVDPIDMY